MQPRSATDTLPSGVVELREDVPLKGWGGAGAGWARWCAGRGGPTTIATCFGALSLGITVALMAQVYSGDYEVVPHGSVATGAANCSRAGTDQLKAGGRALDAAVAAALCLAVASPHVTSLDASGAMLYWEYRQQRTTVPTAVEWGGAGGADAGGRAPRLVAALAALHARLGALPWATLLQPAIDQARSGFPVSEGLAAALALETVDGSHSPEVGSLTTAPQITDYLQSLQKNTSAELTAAWGGEQLLKSFSVVATKAGRWRVYAGGAGADVLTRALRSALDPPPTTVDDATTRVVDALVHEANTPPGAGESSWPPPPSVSTGLAVVDQLDTYLALVTGLSTAFGSGPATAAGWTRDEPSHTLDLAPFMMVDERVCGTRYVAGGESSGAAAQAAAALGAGAPPAAVERARVAVRAGGALVPEGSGVLNASLPYAAVNLVQQTADALVSHADSRGGGVASRF